MGANGSGKSTTINYFCGKKIEIKEVQLMKNAKL